MNYAFFNTVEYVIPRVPFQKIARAVLGARFKLSVIFASPQKIRSLNRIYRRKDSTTDILAFPFSEVHGELYISMPDVKKRALKFHLSPKDYLAYLFIHGCLHVKGFDHGTRMDRLEREYCKKLGLLYPTHAQNSKY